MKANNSFFHALLLLVFLFACDSKTETGRGPTYDPYLDANDIEFPDLDYELYTKAILIEFGNYSDLKVVDISLSINADASISIFERIRNLYPNADDDWLHDYTEKNKDKYLVKDNFSENKNEPKIDLIRSSLLQKLNKDVPKFWKNLKKKYPELDGYIQFSRIAYNKDTTKAYFNMDMYCGSLCGYGQIIVFNKQNGEWILSDTIDAWIN